MFALASVGAIGSSRGVRIWAWVGEAVERRGRELLVAEDLDPTRGIGGEDRGAALITLREQMKEQLAAGALQWDNALTIQLRQDPLITLRECGEPTFVAGPPHPLMVGVINKPGDAQSG